MTAQAPISAPTSPPSHAKGASSEALDATLVAPGPRDGSLDRTISFADAGEDHGLPQTLGGDEAGGGSRAANGAAEGAPAKKTITVFPRVERQGNRVVLVPRTQPRYEEERLLGEGGMGEVALALDHDIDRRVAIKRLLDAESTNSISRFIDEVRTVGNLEHPNIAPVHDVGIDEQGRYFFVMKYIEGEDLESIIEKLKAGDPEYHAEYTFERRTDVFISLLQALSYAHSKGILHRDLKPGNVMIGQHGEVMLTDWGIARPIGAPVSAEELMAEAERAKGGLKEEPKKTGPAGAIGHTTGATQSRASSTRVGALIGTPAYMSPEQALGETEGLDVRSDLYSATMVFFELLTLRHPLDDKKSLQEILRGVVEEEAVGGWQDFLNEVQDVVPPEFHHFVRRGLKKSPKERWQSADEMIEELGRIRRGEIRAQCTATAIRRYSYKWVHFVGRNPGAAIRLVFGGAAALGVGGLGALGGALYLLLS